MRKVISFLCMMLVLLPVVSFAQVGTLVNAKTFTGNASSAGTRTAGLNVGTLEVVWFKSGTVSGCTLTIQSDTALAFSSPSTVGAAQTCTSSGSYRIVGATAANYIRATVSSWTGTGSVRVVVRMYPDTAASGADLQASDCSTAAACSATVLNGAGLKIVTGSVPLSSGTPSTATVTGLSPAFTSSSSYRCAVVPEGATAAIAAAGVAISYVSGTSFTLTGPNTVTTVMDYVCIGK